MATNTTIEVILRESEKLKAKTAERKRTRLVDEDEIRDREMARKILKRIRDAHVTDHDKAIIRELGECRSVNFVAEKMELDLVLTAAIIDGIV